MRAWEASILLISDNCQSVRATSHKSNLARSDVSPKWSWRAALVLFVVTQCLVHAVTIAAASEAKVLTVWGEAAVTTDRAADRERALANGRRSALEQVVGVFVSSKTLTQNAQVVEDRIYTHAEGFINNVEVLQEERRDTHRLQIRASVSLTPVTDVLRRSGLLRKWRVGILLEPHRDRVTIMRRWYSHSQLLEVSQKMESELGQALAQAGFKLMDPRFLTTLRKAGNDAALVKAASSANVDLLIKGSISLMYRSVGGALHQGTSQLHGKVLRVDTGEIVYQGTIGNTFDGTSLLVSQAIAEKFMDSHGNGQLADGTPDLRTYGGEAIAALDKAMQLSSAMAAHVMVEQISRIPAAGRSFVVVEVTGLDFDQLLTLEDWLGEQDGVASVHTEAMTEAAQTLEVEYNSTAMPLARTLSRSKMAKELKLKVKRVTKSKIVLGKK